MEVSAMFVAITIFLTPFGGTTNILDCSAEVSEECNGWITASPNAALLSKDVNSLVISANPYD
jgi:hypothetical protein